MTATPTTRSYFEDGFPFPSGRNEFCRRVRPLLDAIAEVGSEAMRERMLDAITPALFDLAAVCWRECIDNETMEMSRQALRAIRDHYRANVPAWQTGWPPSGIDLLAVIGGGIELAFTRHGRLYMQSTVDGAEIEVEPTQLERWLFIPGLPNDS